MDPNTIAYRWARFQELLEQREDTAHDFDVEPPPSDEDISPTSDSSSRECLVGNTTPDHS
jgi:hypothetical protein